MRNNYNRKARLRPGTIVITVRNAFLNKELARYVLPLDPKRSIFGWYSKFWKAQRLFFASSEKIDKRFIEARIEYEAKRTNRAIITLPCGVSMDSPFELEPIDVDIITLHLEAYRLSQIGYRTPSQHRDIQRITHPTER